MGGERYTASGSPKWNFQYRNPATHSTVPGCFPLLDLSLQRESHLWDVTVDLNRSIYHWIFAKNLPGDSPDDLGGVCDAQPTLFGHSVDSQKKHLSGGGKIIPGAPITDFSELLISGLYKSEVFYDETQF